MLLFSRNIRMITYRYNMTSWQSCTYSEAIFVTKATLLIVLVAESRVNPKSCKISDVAGLYFIYFSKKLNWEMRGRKKLWIKLYLWRVRHMSQKEVQTFYNEKKLGCKHILSLILDDQPVIPIYHKYRQYSVRRLMFFNYQMI